MKGIPAIPLIRTLIKFAAEKRLPLKVSSWESIMRTFELYTKQVKNLN